MSEVETEIINKSRTKPLEWDTLMTCSLCGTVTKREEIGLFALEANRHHPTIKFTAEVSEKEINFLDTTVFKGDKFSKDSFFGI